MASAEADYLASQLPGLCVQVADAWLRAEGGGPGANNPLNITRTGSGLDAGYTGGFADYPSVAVGLQAAAWLIIHGSYAGVRAALPTHNPVLQRLAIIASPWAAGHYNHGASFPTVSGPCQAPSGNPSGILPNASPASFTSTSSATSAEVTTFEAFYQPLIGSGKTWGQASADLIAKHFGPLPPPILSVPGAPILGVYDLVSQALVKTGTAAGDPITAANYAAMDAAVKGISTTPIDLNPLDALTAALPGLLVSGGLIVLILLLGYRGLTDLLS